MSNNSQGNSDQGKKLRQTTIGELFGVSDKRKRNENNSGESYIESLRKKRNEGVNNNNLSNANESSSSKFPPFKEKASKSFSNNNNTINYINNNNNSCNGIPTNTKKRVYVEGWNQDHVKLPCHENNVYFQNSKQLSKWYLIKTLLSQKITSVKQLTQVIATINSNWTVQTSTFYSLEVLFESILKQEERDVFFNTTLPCLQKLALELPDLIPKKSIPLLLQDKEYNVELTRKQICCLLFHAFLCTFPRRNKVTNPSDEYYSFPTINFITLFKKSPLRKIKKNNSGNNNSNKNTTPVTNNTTNNNTSVGSSSNDTNNNGGTTEIINIDDTSILDETIIDELVSPLGEDFSFVEEEYEETNLLIEKLKTIIHYFTKMVIYINNNDPIINEIVSFERKVLLQTNEEMVDLVWKKSEEKLCKLEIFDMGTIEDNSPKTLRCCHVDFANCSIGGGVLGFGAVQEEIRFLINTECIVSRLFTEELLDNEVLLIKNSKRFAKYEGYSYSYKFAGDFTDNDPNYSIVCIDAQNYNSNSFRSTRDQYKEHNIVRELNKIYLGFLSSVNNDCTIISTGNLGCGAFGGCPKLKFLIQLMALSQTKMFYEKQEDKAKIFLNYFTFYNIELKKQLKEVYTLLFQLEVSVSELFNIICSYNTKKATPTQDLFGFVVDQLISEQI
ncbi:hypothetical protein ABK040_014150 [Willaertia magna]